jgi:hypothetical protein
MKRLPSLNRCNFPLGIQSVWADVYSLLPLTTTTMNESLNQSFHRKLKVRFSQPTVFIVQIGYIDTPVAARKTRRMVVRGTVTN